MGEKPIVILYTYINCHGGTPHPQSSAIYFGLKVPDYSNMVVEKGKVKLNYC